MHIVVATPTYFPIRGGSEQTVHEWTRRLSRNHDVSIVTLRWRESPSYEELSPRLRVYRMPTYDIRIVGQFVRAIVYCLLLLRVHKKRKVDIVHMGHVLFLGRGVSLFCRITGVPYIATLLGWDTYDPITPLPSRYFPYLARVMNGAWRVVTMSRHMAKAAGRIGCTKEITIIPHGSSFDRDAPASDIDVRQKHGIAEAKRIAFSLQRLEARKGLPYLIQAVPRILKETEDVVFLVGGAGKEKEPLFELAETLGVSHAVVFAEFIADEDLRAYYEQSDVFVLPTLYEAFGLVYVDALVCGLPIVTTRVGGPLDIVTKDVGILVPAADAEAFAEGVIAALRRNWNKEHIQSWSEQYDWDKIVNRYVELYTAATTIAKKQVNK